MEGAELCDPPIGLVPGGDDDGQGDAPDRNRGGAKQPLPADALKGAGEEEEGSKQGRKGFEAFYSKILKASACTLMPCAKRHCTDQGQTHYRFRFKYVFCARFVLSVATEPTTNGPEGGVCTFFISSNTPGKLSKA